MFDDLAEEAPNTDFHYNITDATNFDDAKQALMQYISPVETLDELRIKFHRGYQYNDEPLQHFAIKLRVLCFIAYMSMNSKKKLNKMAIQQFNFGVRNNVMREKLIVHRP